MTGVQTCALPILEKRQGFHVAALEEIAFRKGYITGSQLLALAAPMANNAYGAYLMQLAENGLQ